MLKILIVGGYDVEENQNLDDIHAFCRALGEQVIEQGHTLINACQTEFDKVLAEAAHEKLQQMGADDVDRRLISFVLTGSDPVHNFGCIIRSQLASWDPGENALFVPEPVELADAAIVVRGYEGTKRAAWWVRFAKKPLLPVTYFGGAAEEIYAQEFAGFEDKYSARVEPIDYQELSSAQTDWPQRASIVVSLAEKLATSTSVLVVMSYTNEEPIKTELNNAYANFKMVCEEYDYKCERVNETNTKDSIVSSILAKTEQAAFVIADLTELKQNVFYELGYAKGLKKPVIVTAKEGTELPFDVKDIPTTFWKPADQIRLRDELKNRIEVIAQSQGWSP